MSGHPLEKISHSKPISLIEVIDQSHIVTASVDKVVKVWNIANETPVCIQEFKARSELQKIVYSSRTQTLAFMDNKCTVGIVKIDLES